MENTYQQALAFYNRNDYERALDILEQCEPSAQTIALKNGCITGLKAQYKYLIDESIKMGNTASVEEYASKYKRYIGEDSYIESLTHAATNRSNLASSEENESQPWYDQKVAGMELKYILGVLAVVALAVVLYLNFGGQNNKIEQAPAEDTVAVAYADDPAEETYDTSQQTDYVENEVEDTYEDESSQNYTQFDFRGTVNDKYEIAGTLRVDNEGRIYGRYCYISTLNKYGDHPNTWITLNGNVDNSGDATIRGTYYKNASEEEYWRGHLQRYDGQYTFSGQFENNDGTVLSMYLRSI